MTPYQKQKQKKRTIISFLAAFLFHLLIFGGLILYDFLFVEDLSEYSGPILVKLGEPEGEDIPVLPKEEVPESQDVPDTAVPSESLDDPSLSSDSPAVPAPEPVSDTAERPVPAEPQKSTDTETAAESNPQEMPVESQSAKPAEPSVKIVEGSEAGNSWEYQYESGGRVGRSFGAEIYLYMPLPQYVGMDLFNRVTGESYSQGTSRQEFILKYYKTLNNQLFLEGDPPLDDVSALWAYLIDAGYDYLNADYKAGGFLKPVVLSFSISPKGDLINVEIQKSSGNPEVDQSVLEGFQNAAFYNSEDREINGRFTYRFQ